MMSHDAIIDQQIDDLRERMRLLQQDRRANIDILEASKASNAEEIRSLREENKALRLRLTQLKKSPESSERGPQEVSSLKKEVLSLRTEYDSLRVSSEKNKSLLNKLKDEQKLCELEAKRPNQEDSLISRQIRMLENRLDKTMIKYNEAQSIKNTYEHIFKRLNDERVSFDNQLSALERTLHSKTRDYDDLLLLAGDASHARDVAQQKLQQSRLQYEDQRSQRESKLRERQQIVKVRKQIRERQQQRERKRKEILESQNKLDSSENDIDLSTTGSHAEILRNRENSDAMYLEEEEQENKLDVYENAFRKIKDATGVSDVNDVINKILRQESTTENLMSQTNQNQERIEEVIILIEQFKKNVENLKYSTTSAGQCKQIVDGKEKQLTETLRRLDQSKSKHERVSKHFMSIVTGVRHLQNKVEIVSNEVGAGKIILSDKNIADVLKASGDVLVEVLLRVNRCHHSLGRANNSCDGDDEKNNITKNCNVFDALETLSEDEVQGNRPFNQRVRLPAVKGNDFMENICNLNDGFEEFDEEELSREWVKKNSSQILQAQERKKRREKRRACYTS